MNNKVEPRTLPGFTYERVGFLPIDTPIIEMAEVLLAKAGGETEKQIYRFQKGDNDLAMRFDLTVPLAKYVTEYYNDISFPFRRYQIGKVYRGERPQKGRFREFYQCDIDIIGDGSLSIMNDAEIPSVIYSTFKSLGFEDFTICINNRKILNGLFKSLDLEEKSGDILRVIDKIEKIGKENVIKELEDEGVEKAKIEAKQLLLSAKEEANYTIKSLTSLYENLKELENINLENCSDSEIANFVKQHFQKGSLKKANEIRSQLNSSLEEFTTVPKNVKKENSKWKKEDLRVGMQIKLLNFQEFATITSLSGKANQLQVQIGNAKMGIKITDIEEIKTGNFPTVSYATSHSSAPSFKSKAVTPEINVIGQNIEEACFVIDKYLDDCSLAKLSSIRIVHGKGTGKLREGIHAFLRKHPHVKSFRLGSFGEGEMGVSIVELR